MADRVYMAGRLQHYAEPDIYHLQNSDNLLRTDSCSTIGTIYTYHSLGIHQASIRSWPNSHSNYIIPSMLVEVPYIV